MYTTIISVSNAVERDRMVRSITRNLTADPITSVVVDVEPPNTIRAYHKTKSVPILIGTYTVVIIPINVPVEALLTIKGDTYYFLDNTITHLMDIVKRLQDLNRKKYKKGDLNASTRKIGEQLDRLLCGANEEH